MDTRQSAEPPKIAIVAGSISASVTTVQSCQSHAGTLSTDAASEPPQQMQQMQQQWDTVVRKELKLPDRYQNVAVLLIRWADHLDIDLGCREEVLELGELFSKDFGFRCENVVLDNKKRPQAQLDKSIADFVYKYDGPHRQNLLIVYYSGHGCVEKQGNCQSDNFFISGKPDPLEKAGDDPYDPVIQWEDAEVPLKRAEADVLGIMDCCFAGSIMKGSTRDSRAFQLLAAVGRDDMACEPGPKSYTRALINALRAYLDKGGSEAVNTYALNQEIIRMQREKPRAQIFNRLQSCTRAIRLAPLQPETPIERTSQHATGHLDLRLTFSGDADDHMGELARQVAKAARKSQLRILGIDLKDFDVYKRDSFRMAMSCQRLGRYWQDITKRKRSEDSCEEDHQSKRRKSENICLKDHEGARGQGHITAPSSH